MAKEIVAQLRTVAAEVERANAAVATFYARNLTDDWTVRIGSAEGVTDDHDLVGWAHRDDHGPPAHVTGSIDAKYVPTPIEARDAMSDLGQLVPGATNILIVDLSGRPMDSTYTLPCYEEAARAATATHKMFSAVLLTGRTCRLRPVPGIEFESYAWYRAVASDSSSAPLSRAEVALLERPGLIVPGSSVVVPGAGRD